MIHDNKHSIVRLSFTTRVLISCKSFVTFMSFKILCINNYFLTFYFKNFPIYNDFWCLTFVIVNLFIKWNSAHFYEKIKADYYQKTFLLFGNIDIHQKFSIKSQNIILLFWECTVKSYKTRHIFDFSDRWLLISA